MKITKIGFMVLGIVFLMFVIAPYASAQPAISGVWYKGTASLKGYEVSSTEVLGKVSGKGKIYVNIEAGVDEYEVTTCIEDMEVDDVWRLSTTTIPTADIVGTIAVGETMIWNFLQNSSMVFDVGGDGPFTLYPMFTAKIGKSSISFKSFACVGYDETSTDSLGLGSCTVSFKSIDPLKVPTGLNACIRP
jgi:hypothetical protein